MQYCCRFREENVKRQSPSLGLSTNRVFAVRVSEALSPSFSLSLTSPPATFFLTAHRGHLMVLNYGFPLHISSNHFLREASQLSPLKWLPCHKPHIFSLKTLGIPVFVQSLSFLKTASFVRAGTMSTWITTIFPTSIPSMN